MNNKGILYIIGKMLGIEALILLIPMMVSMGHREESYFAFLCTSALLFALSFLFTRKKPDTVGIYAKEGLVIVALSWIIWSVFGALPYYISGEIEFYINCFFETVSGFTTTGASILTEIESLPKGILFWRNLTEWIGGMGVLVFALAIIPLSDKSSMHLMRAEMPGPAVGKLEPKIRSTAKILYSIYLVLTIALVIFLLSGGMSLFDAVMHAFSTAGTGGFSNRNANIGYYNSTYIEGVLAVFMILFGINFNIFHFFVFKNKRGALKNEELKYYFGLFVAAVGAITINILPLYQSTIKALHHAVFQVASLISTTTYYSTDYNLWPEFSKMILLVIMVIGGCAGSTSGGIKISRVVIGYKIIKNEIRTMLHPRSVNALKMDGKVIGEETTHGIFVYMTCYVFILSISVLLISLDDFNFTSNVTGVLAMLSNVGTGFGSIGPGGNYHAFSWFSKLVLCVDMLFGRLEIIPMLMLLSPSLWRKKF